MRLQAWRVANAKQTRAETADEVMATWSTSQIREWCEVQRIAQKEIDSD